MSIQKQNALMNRKTNRNRQIKTMSESSMLNLNQALKSRMSPIKAEEKELGDVRSQKYILS